MKKRAMLLSGFVVLSLLTAFGVLDVCGCTGFNGNAREVEAARQTNQAPTADSKVVAYYLHGTTRCNTCRTIEAYATEAVQTGFGDALKAGKVEWRTLNVEEPANRHFIKDYQLYTRSVVLASYQGDKQLRWKNLEKVWELVGDKPGFTRYVQTEVKSFLEAR
ncbi:MAG: hypothetical protein EHM61_07040 [Acidobacteria bacterium]|nr:MAG: hypothetical protein EHM61_07040 [Acidobacteriota bacterium]